MKLSTVPLDALKTTRGPEMIWIIERSESIQIIWGSFLEHLMDTYGGGSLPKHGT